jgi:hypothetical protein
MKIALVGKKAAGKSFVAFYLKQKYHFKRMKLQDGIDTLIRTFYGLEKMKRPSWEKRLDFYNALYKVDPNVHVNYLLRRLETTTMPNVVVEDPRYGNEVVALGKAGFTVVRIITDETVRKRRIGKGLRDAAAGSVILTEYFNTDPSRAYKVDYNVQNITRDGTRKIIDDLILKLDTK